MTLRLLDAKLGRGRRDAARITFEADEQDLEYLTDIMQDERIRSPRDGAPRDYLATLAEAAQRLADEREFRANQPTLVIRMVLS